jgi:hypothetical protein
MVKSEPASWKVEGILERKSRARRQEAVTEQDV